MKPRKRPARLNVTLILLLVVGVVALAAGAVLLRQWRGTHLARQSLAEASAAEDAGDFDTAAKRYQDYLGRYPHDVSVLECWAQANLQARPRQPKHLNKAVQAYRELLRLRPGEESYLRPLVRLHARAYDAPDQLLYWAKMWRDAHPESVPAALWLGRAMTASGQYDEARKVLLSVTARPEPTPDAYILLGLLEESAAAGAAGMPVARKQFEIGVERCPDSAKLAAYFGRFLLRSEHRPAEARAELERAESLPISSTTLHMRLFDEWSDLRDVPRAEAHLRAAREAPEAQRAASIAEEIVVDIGEEPESWQLFLFRADTRLIRLKIAERLVPASEAGRLADEWADKLQLLTGRELEYLPSLVELYGLAARGSDAKKCADDYRAALNPTSPRADVQRAWATVYDAIAILALNQPDGAYRVIALPDEIRAPRILLYKGLCLQRIGQIARARAMMERYLQAEPGDPEGLWHLTDILVDLRAWEDVLKQAQQLASFEAYREIAAWAQVRAEIALLPADAAQIPADRAAELRTRIQSVNLPDPADRLDARLWLAALEERAGRLEEAERILRQPPAQDMDPREATAALASFLMEHHRLDEAVQVCIDAAAADPENIRLQLLLAEVCERDEKLDAARAALDRALALAPNDRATGHDAVLAMSAYRLRRGEPGEALALLEKLRREDATEPRCRALLLEARLDTVEDVAPFNVAETQTLVNELKAIESETEGLRWRFYQARLLLRTAVPADGAAAAKLLQECLQRDPTFSAAALALGVHLEEQARPGEAEAVYRRALTVNPRAVQIADRLLRLLQSQARFGEASQVADLLAAAGRDVSPRRVAIALGDDRPADAVNILRQQIVEHPDDGDARFLLAQLLSQGGAPYDSVAPLLDETERLLPDAPAIAVARCEMLEREGRWDEAEALCDRRVDAHPGYASHLLRGRFLFRRGRIEEAEADFKRLPELPEDPAEGYFLLGRFYAETGRAEQAIATMQSGRAALPDALTLKQGLSELLLSSPIESNRAAGRRLLETSLAQHPDDPLLRLLSAATLHENGDGASASEAERILKEVIAARPTLLQAHLLRIQIVRERGQEEEAMSLCREALRHLPRNSSLRLVQADIERRRGNLAQSRTLAQDVLSRDPANTLARLLLVDLARTEQSFTGEGGAVNLVEAAVANDPNNDQAQVKRALTLQEAGRASEAIAALTDYVHSRGDAASRSLLATLADLHVVAGNAEEAERWLSRAAATGPRDPEVLLVTARLAARRGRFDELAAFLDQCRKDGITDERLYVQGANLLAVHATPASLQAARTLLTLVTQRNPAHHEAWLALASVDYALGDRAAARQAYEIVLAGEPRDRRHLVVALNGAAWTLHEDGLDPKRALELADRAVALDAANLNVLDTRAHILERAEALQRAKADYRQVALLAEQGNQRPQWAVALVDLGRVLLALGEKEEAESRLRQAKAMHEESACLSEATLNELKALLARIGA